MILQDILGKFKCFDFSNFYITRCNESPRAGGASNQVLTTNFFRYNASVARSSTFINLREINGRFRLKPGK